MNKRFSDYLDGLTPKRRDIAEEAVRIFLACENENMESLSCGVDVYNLCRDMTLLDVEHFDVLLMNRSYKLIKRFTLGIGGLTEVSVDIRVMIREACLNNATVIAVVHNHPSGSIRPSNCDDQITQAIRKACDIMRITFLDHVIIGNGAYYSYHENGKI